mmetsp:Transcript_40707/g.121412  ORF Transcript_40707/g.121412 Transcript_40707/m.121412 type:complete len:455 (+) Transcript_40707:3177-4541(+)
MVALDGGCERYDRRRAEYERAGNLHAEPRAQHVVCLARQHARAAKLREEVGGGADRRLKAQHLGPHLLDERLQLALWRDVLARSGRVGGRPVDGWEAAAVDLSVGQRGELGHRHDHLWDHMVRQRGAQRLHYRRRVDILRRNKRDEPALAAGVLLHRRDGGSHAGRRPHRSLNLAKFDPEAADLDLAVVTSNVLDVTARHPTHEVAALVHARVACFAAGIRVRDELLGGDVGAVHVAVRKLRARDVQLARHADRARLQARVEHVEAHVVHRPSNGVADEAGVVDRVLWLERLGAAADGGLCRAVLVDERRVWQLLAELRSELRTHGLATHDDAREAGTLTRCELVEEHVERRRHPAAKRDARRLNRLLQVQRVAVAVRLGDGEAAACAKRHEDLLHRHVKRKRCLGQAAVARHNAVPLHSPRDQVEQAAVAQHRALWPSRRPAREDHVRQAVGP